ncbi:hypothetical protein [Treponema sp.]|uniref:hypothetical protein n=1 Tax=Treponema sp. TaxID=166 RepID=UPI00388EFEA4
MFKVKNIATAAICGFVLSFLISIISTHKAGVSLLRGVIFALVFAALAFAIDFLNSRFLDVDGGIGVDSGDDVSRKASAGAGTGSGSIVNITIDDENLTEDDQAPAFDVSSGRQVFSYRPESRPQEKTVPPAVQPQAPASSSGALAENAPVEEAPATADGAQFKPMELGKPIESGEVVKNDSPQSQESASAKKSSGVKEIDALPDIGEFSAQDNDVGDNGSVAPVISDSEFAQSGDMKASAAMTEGGDMMKQDSKIIASAIRTLLKKED